MQPVTVFNQDIADVLDVNRISTFGETAFETLLESITQGKRSLLWGGVAPFIFAQAAPDITIRVPAQYFAVEARSALFALTDIVITHPSPATAYDFYIYLMIRLADQSESRDNVNITTFAETPTSRVTHKLEETEYAVENVANPGAQPFPATGAGVPSAGYERLGYVEIARFTWDGTAAVPVITFNSTDVISLGTAGLPLHGGTHVTTDPIPHANDTNRGMLAKKSQSYVKESLIRVEPAAGAPIVATPIGTNGPAGAYNFDVYNPSTAKGISLDLLFDGSLEVVASELKVKYGTPPGGAAGADLEAARADHGHLVFTADPIYKKHNDSGFTGISPISTSFVSTPTTPSVVPSFGGGYAGRVALVQVEMQKLPNAQVDAYLIVTGGSSVKRYAASGVGGNNQVISTTFLVLPLDGAGSVTIQGSNAPSNYRISLVGIFGQG